jgi:hypothetical protein
MAWRTCNGLVYVNDETKERLEICGSIGDYWVEYYDGNFVKIMRKNFKSTCEARGFLLKTLSKICRERRG